jgi:hypothetical protein
MASNTDCVSRSCFTLTREFDPPRIDGLPKANAPKSLIEVTQEEPRAMPPMEAMRWAGFIVQLVLQRMILVTTRGASQHFCVYSLPRHLAMLQNGGAQC